MLLERQSFLDALTAIANDDNLEEVDRLASYFALYERELIDKITFLVQQLGLISVIGDVEGARQVAAETIREANYRWEG